MSALGHCLAAAEFGFGTVAVHRDVVYDLEVDTTHAEAMECARAIAARVG